MELRDYFYYEKVRVNDLAKRVGISLASMSKITHKRSKPSIPIARVIEWETGGKVTAMELLKEKNMNPVDDKALSA